MQNATQKDQSYFRVIEGQDENTITCRNLVTGVVFSPRVKHEGFDQAKKGIAEIEHEGMTKDGTPVNPVVVEVRNWNWSWLNKAWTVK